MDESESFGFWIRRRRKALDLTHKVLADQVGCAVITIRKIEADERRPSRQIAERLAECLAVPPADREAFMRAARAELAAFRLPTPPTPSPLSLPSPRSTPPALRGYQVHEQIGAGGFGTVYRATQPGINREVAIKLIAPEFANHPDFVRRFEAEAQLVARLEHPFIVPLYDYWRDPSGAYLVMRYLRGGSVQAALTAPWSLERCSLLLADIGPALAFAHRQGVIHRDLKPANLLLDTEGRAYLADFGIARELHRAQPDDHTQPAVVIGSPEYLAPEQFADAPLTPAADIYGLGLALYVLLAGAPPYHSVAPVERLAQRLNGPLPPLAALRSDLPAAVDAALQRATARLPADRYQTIEAFLADWQRAVGAPGAATASITAGSIERAPIEQRAPSANPYKGLRAFGEGDAADFFGREALTRRLIERLAGDSAEDEGVTSDSPAAGRFLAVVGPSGSGKSSVVRASLLPALRNGALPGSEQWFYAELLPGSRPLEEIEAALLRVAVNPPDQLLSQLHEDERGLARAVKRVLPADPSVELVLVIDQFEEIFTLLETEATRLHLLASLTAAVCDPRSRLRLIVTLRADFYDRPLLYPGFADLLPTGVELVLPLSAAELRRAIVGPAERAGVSVEADLVAEMIRDVGEQPGALPLLQYALTELYADRDNAVLSLAAYRSGGGVAGALARRADLLYTGFEANEQLAVRQIFLRLITLGEGVEDTRRRVRLSELSNAEQPVELSHPVLTSYGGYRLLTFDRDPLTREPTVEVAHEALIRSWSRLREWLATGRDALRVQRRLSLAAAEWANAGHDPSFLASGSRLVQFVGLATSADLALNADERAFLEASQAAAAQAEQIEAERQQRELLAAQQLAAAEAARAAQQQQAATRLRRRAYGLAGALTAALMLAGVAFYFSITAGRNAQTAEAARQLAISRELSAAAVNNLNVDPERSILLALEALEAAETRQAGDALHQAVMASRIQHVLPVETIDPPLFVNVLFSPDAALAAAAGFNFTEPLTTTVFDAATGAVRYRIPGFLMSLDWPAGRFLITEHPPAENLTFTVWETTATEARPVREVQLPVRFADVFWYDVLLEHDLVAVSRRNSPVIVYRLSDGRELFVTDASGAQLNNPVFSPDGAYLAAVTADRAVKVWQRSTDAAGNSTFAPASNTDKYPLRGLTTEINILRFSPDGTRLAAPAFDGTVLVWDLSYADALPESALAAGQIDPRLRYTLHGHTNDVNFAAWSADGQRLATASRDRKVIIWDMRNGARQITLAGHADAVHQVRFSADGTRLISGGADNSARIWDVTPAAEVRGFSVAPPTTTNYWQPMALSRDGRRIIAGNPETTAAVSIFDAATGAPVVTLDTADDRTGGVALSADGSIAATASAGQPGQERGAAPAVAVWDVATGKQIARFPNQAGFFLVALSPAGHQVAAGDFDGTIHLWNIADGRERVLAPPDASAESWAIVFSPDGEQIAASAVGAGSDAASIEIWDTSDGTHVLHLDAHASRIFSLAFDQDGDRLASVSRDGTAKIWDLTSGALLQTMTGHTSTVMGVAWSPDDARIATAALDSTIRLWDVNSGQELRTLVSPSGPSDLFFSPDGEALYVSSVDGYVRVYLTGLDDLVALAQTRVTRELTQGECVVYLHTEACP
jgi:WD40 repeat protein/transcriptional regulator with XRE-family HTH domain